MIFTSTVARGGNYLEIRDAHRPGFEIDHAAADRKIAELLNLNGTETQWDIMHHPAVKQSNTRKFLSRHKGQGGNTKRTTTDIRKALKKMRLPYEPITWDQIRCYNEVRPTFEFYQCYFTHRTRRIKFPMFKDRDEVRANKEYWCKIVNDEINSRIASGQTCTDIKQRRRDKFAAKLQYIARLPLNEISISGCHYYRRKELKNWDVRLIVSHTGRRTTIHYGQVEPENREEASMDMCRLINAEIRRRKEQC
ncbi:MAG: hypothetical protein HGA87_00865 [Desulfobulbaceae bacterium]|nr:hypothetical protein [Desulfobulbaceae bacterium]